MSPRTIGWMGKPRAQLEIVRDGSGSINVRYAPAFRSTVRTPVPAITSDLANLDDLLRQVSDSIATSARKAAGAPGLPSATDADLEMIGNTLLNEAVRQKGEREPASILSRLHKDMRTALHQDAGSDTRDGLDVAAVRLDFANGKIHYAGANRPLIMVHNGELREIRADKMPIGGLQGEEERNFTGHSFTVEKGTMIYIFTDGFADQFGGPKGKKFMVKK